MQPHNIPPRGIQNFTPLFHSFWNWFIQSITDLPEFVEVCHMSKNRCVRAFSWSAVFWILNSASFLSESVKFSLCVKITSFHEQPCIFFYMELHVSWNYLYICWNYNVGVCFSQKKAFWKAIFRSRWKEQKI